MIRKIQNDVRYPFMAKDTLDTVFIAGIKDAIFTIAPSKEINNTSYVSLHSIGDPLDYKLIFRAYPNSDEPSTYSEITFNIDNFTGPGSIRSIDGLSCLFVNTSQLNKHLNTTILDKTRYVIEPAIVRWMSPVITNIHYVNEYKNHDVNDRGNLVNTEIHSDTSGINIKNGYNTYISFLGKDVSIGASPGIGKGVAPNNMWDSTFVEPETDGLKSINNIPADASGNINITTSNSMELVMGVGLLTIKHNGEIQ